MSHSVIIPQENHVVNSIHSGFSPAQDKTSDNNYYKGSYHHKELNIMHHFSLLPIGNDADDFGSNIGQNLVSNRDSILNERWEKTSLVPAKIIKITDQQVHCDCIISKEEAKVEVRAFPKILFQNIQPLKVDALAMIKISMKASAVRTDIIDGKGLGIEKDFEQFNNWEKLKGFENKRAF